MDQYCFTFAKIIAMQMFKPSNVECPSLLYGKSNLVQGFTASLHVIASVLTSNLTMPITPHGLYLAAVNVELGALEELNVLYKNNVNKQICSSRLQVATSKFRII